jgi:hypothetical protein
VSFYSVNSFAKPVSWSAAEGNCDAASGLQCKVGKAVFCNKKTADSENCGINTPTINKGDLEQMKAQAFKACNDRFKQAQSCTQGISKDVLPSLGLNGTKDICDTYKSETDRAKAVNLVVAGKCRGTAAACIEVCKDVIDQLVKADTSPTRPSAIDMGAMGVGSLQGLQQSCQGMLSGVVIPLEGQAGTDDSAAGVGKICSNESSEGPGKDGKGGDSKDGSGKKDSNQAKSATGSNGLGGLNPQSLMQLMQAMNQNQNEDQTQPEQPAFQDCSANPNIAGCMQAQSLPQSWNQAAGETSSSSTDNSGGDFNTPDIGGMQPSSLNPQQQQYGTPATTASIPNGGGQMLGGGGSSSASLGGAQPASYGGGGGKKVEVQTGGGGGGYSQTAAGMNMKNGESGGGYTYGGRGTESGDSNFDLSSFLPGGKHDPFKGRSLAGTASGTGNFQIQSKDVNLFSRISERIKSRCAQGLLRDCIP